MTRFSTPARLGGGAVLQWRPLQDWTCSQLSSCGDVGLYDGRPLRNHTATTIIQAATVRLEPLMSKRAIVVFSTLLAGLLVCQYPPCLASTFSASAPGIRSLTPNAINWYGNYQGGYATAYAFAAPSELESAVEVQSRDYSSLTTSLSATSAFSLNGFSITGPPGQIPASLSLAVSFIINDTQEPASQYTSTPWGASVTVSSSLQDPWQTSRRIWAPSRWARTI